MISWKYIGGYEGKQWSTSCGQTKEQGTIFKSSSSSNNEHQHEFLCELRHFMNNCFTKFIMAPIFTKPVVLTKQVNYICFTRWLTNIRFTFQTVLIQATQKLYNIITRQIILHDHVMQLILQLSSIASILWPWHLWVFSYRLNLRWSNGTKFLNRVYIRLIIDMFQYRLLPLIRYFPQRRHYDQ